MADEREHGDLAGWCGVPDPEQVVLEDRYARLEPITSNHVADLFAATEGRPELFTYLFEEPPTSAAALGAWIEEVRSRTDLLMWAVINRATGRAEGRQALMRIEPAHGVIELGSILWGPGMARTRVATDAFRLHAGYVFEALGYRRLEWKCHADNAASKRAALRFGFEFEGRFAQHMVIKGRSRDTAWFALLDRDWPAQSALLDGWLEPANFDADGVQRSPLARKGASRAGRQGLPAPSAIQPG